MVIQRKKYPQGISASRLARKTILTAIPMFSGSNFPMSLSVTLSDETGSQKSKMAAQNYLISSISVNIHDSTEFPTANPTFSPFSIYMKLLPILFDVSGSRKSKMAVCTPEVGLLLAQLLHDIAAIFD